LSGQNAVSDFQGNKDKRLRIPADVELENFRFQAHRAERLALLFQRQVFSCFPQNSYGIRFFHQSFGIST
jgi:hypothetical protein